MRSWNLEFQLLHLYIEKSTFPNKKSWMAELAKAPVFYHAEGCGFNPHDRRIPFLLHFCPRVWCCLKYLHHLELQIVIHKYLLLCKYFIIILWQLFNFEVKSGGNCHGNCIVWRPGTAASVKQIKHTTYEPSASITVLY